MFEGRKASRLNIEDLGGVPKGRMMTEQFYHTGRGRPYVSVVNKHAPCETRLRNGKRKANGQRITWCPKCVIIMQDA